MSTATLTDQDLRVRDAVLHQLEWDPAIDASAIGVTAKSGTITLTGYINSYSGKLAAERAAKRVRGVRSVANDIEVRLKLERVDADIAADVAKALELGATIPNSVQATVRSGHVTLTGTVDWMYQKHDAERAVRHIRGVHNVMNRIAIAPGAVERDVRHRIVEALHRNADIDARHVRVTVAGDCATLTGTVGTWLQRDTAERAAADAPGIRVVDNRVVVEPGRAPDEDEIC
ncbi:MAG TPA: BON domain-containing protein [Vicinamibacterales bacterium]|jgi:osmotically-inducible protein OsmY|nr:BON domain-containing protein [Vicinamibacterales bacterium]